jgi:hypothetical protein
VKLFRAIADAVGMGPLRKFFISARGEKSRVPLTPPLPRGLSMTVAGGICVLLVPIGTGVVAVRLLPHESRALAWAGWEAARVAEFNERETHAGD